MENSGAGRSFSFAGQGIYDKPKKYLDIMLK